MEHLGHRVKALREKAELTQGDLAEKLGLNRASLSIIESKGKTSNETLSAIVKYFKVSKEWLLTGEGERPKGIIIKLDTGRDNPYKDFAIQKMSEEIEFYKEIIRNLTSGKEGKAKENFLKAPNQAGAAGKVVTMVPTQRGARLGAQA